VEAARIPTAALPVERLSIQWRELKAEAVAQGQSVLQLSSVMALAAVRELPENVRWLSQAARVCGKRTGEVLGRGLLDHYSKSLAEIRDTGYLRYWLREFQPYWKGAIRQFSTQQVSATERLLDRRRAQKAPPSIVEATPPAPQPEANNPIATPIPIHRTHPETKTTVALKNINAMKQWIAAWTPRGHLPFLHSRITSAAHTVVKP
jgi:hypothetical protein